MRSLLNKRFQADSWNSCRGYRKEGEKTLPVPTGFPPAIPKPVIHGWSLSSLFLQKPEFAGQFSSLPLFMTLKESN